MRERFSHAACCSVSGGDGLTRDVRRISESRLLCGPGVEGRYARGRASRLAAAGPRGDRGHRLVQSFGDVSAPWTALDSQLHLSVGYSVGDLPAHSHVHCGAWRIVQSRIHCSTTGSDLGMRGGRGGWSVVEVGGARRGGSGARHRIDESHLWGRRVGSFGPWRGRGSLVCAVR